MIPFALALLLGGYVLMWTGIKTDGRPDHYNPLHLVISSLRGAA